MTSLSRRRLRGFAVVPVAALALVAPSVGAHASSTGSTQAASKARVSVMTRNLYLGADLTPVLSAANPITGIATVVNTVEASDPATRMAAVAKEIAQRQPMLVGLQEVASWQIAGKNPLDPTQQLAPAASYDFLALLLHDLAADGTRYRVVVTQTNFDSTKQLPTLLEALASFTDRDVILARSGVPTSQLKVLRTKAGHYTHQLDLPITSLGATVNFDRGYEWADVNTGGVVWRFVNTHPEAYAPSDLGLPGNDVNGPQAQELVKALKGFDKPIVIASDLNSAVNDKTRLAYAVLKKAGFADTWLELGHPNTANTCCHDETLSSGALTERIDHVLARGTITPLAAHRVGVAATSATPPRWPTDHAGVITKLSIR